MTEMWDTRMSEGRVICYPVAANAVIYAGALMVVVDGSIRSFDNEAGEWGTFIGIAADGVDATGYSDGELKIRVIKTGAHNYKTGPHNFKSVGDINERLVGKTVYAFDACSVCFDMEAGPEVGYLLSANENGTVRIRIDRCVC